MRMALLEKLGDRCCKCGFDNWKALQIDHINGGGSYEMKNIKNNYYKLLNLSDEELKSKYQLLCANCNWIKKYERGETVRNIKGGKWINEKRRIKI